MKDRELEFPGLPKRLHWLVRRALVTPDLFFFQLVIYKKWGIITREELSSEWLRLPTDSTAQEQYVHMQCELLLLQLPHKLTTEGFING